jgi:DNA modification methylase
MNKILHGDSLDLLKDLDDNSVDSIVTDPPYGYSFMGKNWDKAVPSVELWEECLRVLKPGGFAFIMSAPRSDVQSEMIKRLEKAGFKVDFTPVYWTYASGFPKALNIGKAVDKRLGNKREQVKDPEEARRNKKKSDRGIYGDYKDTEYKVTKGNSELEGSYAGYQPKPAVEVVIVVMKPLSEKGYVEQALKNGKGVTWLDDTKIPFDSSVDLEQYDHDRRGNSERTPDVEVGTTMSEVFGQADQSWGYKKQGELPSLEEESPLGRFTANLLVQDNILDSEYYNNNGTFSRYFSLDNWWKSRIQALPLDVQTTYPFMIVKKASKSEKNKGMEEKNYHPTVKPISLMSYLVTLGSREGDLVLDPFVGSGTTCIAAKLLSRKYIGMEMDDEYVVIAQERIKAHKPEKTQHEFF